MYMWTFRKVDIMNYIRLNFYGIMQHYPPSKYVVTAPSSTYYRTERCPTKSSIVGLIGASSGYDRDDIRLIELKNKIDCKYSIIRDGTVIVDFQTVRPIGDEKFRKVDGGLSTGTIIKKVEYLQNYSFNVYVGADDETLKQIYDALRNPVYHQYFGKRSCVPSEPIVTDFNVVDLGVLENVYDCP